MQFTIAVRFITGYCDTARSKTDPRPEWPPHPARIYMALAAAYFECESGKAEHEALDWLESLEPPQIKLGPDFTPDAIKYRRLETPPTFVPMNDSRADPRDGSIQTLPALKRHRAERLFPRIHLPEGQDCIFLCWPDVNKADLEKHREALVRLCSTVARIGHSSSLVQMWVMDEPPEGLSTLMPVENGREMLRVVARTKGTLDRLAIAFTTPPYRPSIKSSQGYALRALPASEAATTIFDDRMELFRIESNGASFRWLQLETTLALSKTLREAILERCPSPIPESISGHSPDGKASALPHLAIVPLPFVGKEHADGHLLGVGIVMPRKMSAEDQGKLIEALNAICENGLCFDAKQYPGLGQWKLIRQGVFDASKVNLQVDTWTASPSGSRTWASVTPFVFDQHGKARSKSAYLDECAERVSEAISRVVATAKVERIRVMPVSPVLGVPTACEFPRLKRKDGSERRHTHVEVLFDRPIVGPLLLGAGRYRGYGLCRPMPEGENQ
ncbi:MAG: type I-U CRISPR-associated protein Csb2 [Bacillota bacterium]